MTSMRGTLVLQAIGPAATLLSVESAARGARGDAAAPRIAVRVLARASAARVGRDVFALDEADVCAALSDAVLRHGLRGRDVTLLVGGMHVTCHRFVLPRLDPASLRKAVRLKLENLLHYGVDQAVLAIEPPADGATGVERPCRVAAMPMEAAMSACAAADRLRLRATRLQPALAGVEALAEFAAADGPQPCVAACIGEHGATLAAIDGGATVMSHETPTALNDLTLALMRPILAPDRSIELPAAQARALRDEIGIPAPAARIASLDLPANCVLPLLQPVLEQWVRSMAQWINFATAGQGREPARLVRLIGPAALLPGLDKALEARLSLPVEADATWARFVTCLDECGGAPVAADAEAASVGAAIGAALRGFELPSLLPRPVARVRRVERGIAALGLGSPVASAGLVVAALLLFRMAHDLAPVAAGQAAAYSGVAERLGEFRLLERDADYVNRLKRDLAVFAGATPNWTGVLKEVARLLPPEMVLRQLEVRGDETGMDLVLSARVDDGGGGRTGFDDVIRRSLLALQASPFFDRVEIVSAARGTAAGGQARPEASNIELRMRLIYPGGDGRAVDSRAGDSGTAADDAGAAPRTDAAEPGTDAGHAPRAAGTAIQPSGAASGGRP